MKKLVIIFAMLGLMFNVISCKAKKAQDETEIVENADVEKIDAEDANFAGNESSVESGPVDESLQAALGETPQTDSTPAGALPEDLSVASTDVVNTDTAVNSDVAATPALDETIIGSNPVAKTDSLDAEITETPVAQSPVETRIETPAAEIAQTEPPVDSSLTPDTTMTGAVTEMNSPAITETPIAETPVVEAPITETPTEVASTVEIPSSPREAKEASAKPAASGNILKKIAETTPYKVGDGFVNTIYIARPKEKLADISRSIYGMDKSKELKSINSFLKAHAPKGGDKIYYVSPNRPSDSSRTISYYEDTGMTASTYVAAKGENLHKVSKKLLGYDNAWKEVWTTNDMASKTKLAAGDTIRYWKGADQIQTSPTLANNEGPAKIIESAQQMPQQMPPSQEVAANIPPPQEVAPPQPQAVAQVAAQQPAQVAAQPTSQELPPPPPPPQELAPPPPPPPQEVAVAPVAPKAKAPHNMEEEPAIEEGAMNSDTMMMMGVVAVLVAALALVLVRRNKKKKEADLASIEQNHVGS